MKKLLAVVLCLLVAMGTLSANMFAAQNTDTDTDDTPSTPQTPVVVIDHDVSILNPTVSAQTINAGDVFYIGFTLNGNSTLTYDGYTNPFHWDSSVRTTVSVSGNGFTLAGSLAEQELFNGYNSVAILSDESLETGRYTVTLTVTCGSATDSRSFNIDVENSTVTLDESKDVPSFILAGASIPQGKGKSELSTKLNIELKNPTNYTARDVEVSISNLGTIVLKTYTDTVNIGDVAGGDTAIATFPIVFPEYPEAQSTVTINVRYHDAAGNELTSSYNVFLQATVKDKAEEPVDTSSLTPKVIVSNYNTDVEKIVSGDEFVLTFVLKNTSLDKDVMNMTVDVIPGTDGTEGSSGTIFSPIDGTTSFYTAQLDKNGELEYSIKLKTSASAGARSYPVTIRYSFEYESNGVYSQGSGEMDINLPVTQPIKFELMEWYPPTECYGSQGCAISFQYFNKSKNPMTNLSVSVEGDFNMPTQYVGTLAASSYDYFSGMIYPNDPTAVGETKTAILVFTFEDASSNEQRVEYPFDVLICEETVVDDPSMGGDIGGDIGTLLPVDPGMPGMTDDTVSEGLPTWAKYLIYIGAPVLVIAVIVVIVVVVKKKRKAALLADDDDDDDEE